MAILALIALTAGVNAIAQGTPAIRQADFIVAVVNSEPVTNSEVLTMRNRLVRELAGRGGQLPPREVLEQQALDLLIQEKAQLQLAQELGIKVDEDQIDQAEANIAAGNQLTREALRERLTREGTTPAAFRNQLKNQLTLSRLREREVEGRIRISEQDIDTYLKEQGQGASSAPAEINLAMILVAVPENATPDQVALAQTRALDIVQRARRGEDFAQLARTYSQAFDKGANGGVMGLRSTERYPELFVQAVSQLRPQEVTDPVRSGAGFHILKLLEVRQATAITVVQTRARHILLRPGAQLTVDQAVARLQELRRDLLAGRTSFARAAQEISQDGSAAQGGDLGWAGPGQFVPEFEQVMSRLQPGEISDPLVSRFGVHIIEVNERRRMAVPEKEQREMARTALREKRLDEAYERWTQDVRGRAYIELREPPQLPAVSLPGAAR